jgi:hypothetical protein
MTTKFISSPLKHPWWSPYRNIGPPARTLDEWSIIAIVNEIKQKPDWKTKFNDESIREKWKNEIKEQLNSKIATKDDLVDIIFGDLRWIVDIEEKALPFKISIDDKIVTADNLIPNSISSLFISQVDDLKQSFDELDYHPKSNNQVIDLVHPSLYPLQYGISPVLCEDGSLKICKFNRDTIVAKEGVSDWGVSKDFQWLPSLLKYDEKEERFTIRSYINNLHPIKHKALYESIESIFNLCIPGLTFVLSRQASSNYVRINWPGYEIYNEEYHSKVDAIFESNKDVDSQEDEYEEFETTKLQYLKPPVLEKNGPKNDKPLVLTEFEGVKVIVKLADIELTPTNPKYDGGSWHVEGTINEDIVATIIYYYDSDNITDSKLSFRTGFEDPMYDQGDGIFCKEIYGIVDEQKMVKNLGSISTCKDRVLIFPNTYQHHVDAFELQDTTKPGYRRILALFVVDPHNDRVIATDKVPPQQEEWWNGNDNDVITEKIKKEIKKLNSALPQSVETAKTVREKLMEDRSPGIIEDTFEHPFEREFSLCEH